MPFLSLEAGLLLAGMVVVAIVVMQQIVLMVHSHWLPVGEWLVFLLFAFLVMLLWSVKQGTFYRERLSFLVWCKNLVSFSVGRDKSLVSRKPSFRDVATRDRSFRDSAIDDVFDDDVLDIADTVIMEAETVREIRRPQNQAAPAVFQKGASASKTIPASDRKRIGHYEILGELGRGAMGIVYLGFDPECTEK